MTQTTARRRTPVAELIIAVLVIGIVIVGMHYLSVRNLNARELELKCSIHSIQLGVERYCVDTDCYPRYLIGGGPGTNGEPSLDPLLAEGYLDTYPRNPFQRTGWSARNPMLQTQVRPDGFVSGGDPLRPGDPLGAAAGYRFGTDGTLMGQVLCDPRLAYWLEQADDGNPGGAASWAAVEYHCWDMWAQDGSQQRVMPGQFFYKTMLVMSHDIVGFPFEETPPTIENEIYCSLLGCYGSVRTKGRDVIGEEHPVNLMDHFYNQGKPPDPKKDYWSWTRSVNDPDSREGSPYGEKVTSTRVSGAKKGSFIDYTNRNGIPDSVILVLHIGFC